MCNRYMGDDSFVATLTAGGAENPAGGDGTEEFCRSGSADLLPSSVRVAFASDTEERVDGHFGACSHFLVYDVAPTAYRLVAARQTSASGSGSERNALRAGLIADCHLLFIASIGGPAAARVVRAGVHPIKVAGSPPAADLIVRLQGVLGGEPPPWLARAMGRKVRDMADAEFEPA